MDSDILLPPVSAPVDTPKTSSSDSKVYIGIILFLLIVCVVVFIFQKNETKSLETQNASLSSSLVDLQNKNAALEAKVTTLEGQNSTLSDKLQKIILETYPAKYFPVKNIGDKSQMVGQTFTLEKQTIVSGVMLKGNFELGNTVKISLYQMKQPNSFEIDTLTAQKIFKAQSDLKEQPFVITFDTPLGLTPNTPYAFTVQSIDPLLESGIGYSETDTSTTGNLFLYTKLPATNDYAWQPQQTQDMIFSLITANL